MRQSYRCAVDESRRQATLRAGGKCVPVDLVDESAGGFGVLAEPGLHLVVGDQVELNTASVCVETEVMHVADAPSPGEGDKLRVRLGLKRIGETVVLPDPRPPWFKRFRVAWLRSPYGTGTPVAGMGVLLVLLVGAVPAIAFLLFGTHAFRDADPNPQPADKRTLPERWTIPASRSEAIRPATTPAETPRGTPGGMSGEPATEKRGNADARSPLDDALGESWQRLLERARLGDDAGKGNDAVLTAMASLTDKLDLSPSRQVRIAEILHHADESLATSPLPQGGVRDEQAERRRLSILENAYNQLIEQLTDAEKTQWAELLKP